MRIGSLRNIIFLLMIGGLWAAPGLPGTADAAEMPFAPGEKLTYELRWENIPAGEARLEVRPNTTIHGKDACHFVMTARSNEFVDLFFKVRDRIDAYADTGMTRSVHYQKQQAEGRHKRDEIIEFDWENSQARYHNFGKPRKPIALAAGSFDPLSAFYYARLAVGIHGKAQVERAVTDGKKSIIGRANVIKRETITLKNGMTVDTRLLIPEMKHVGGVFKQSQGAKIQIWVTADSRCIPVRVKSRVVVGYFVAELVAAEGIDAPMTGSGNP